MKPLNPPFTIFVTSSIVFAGIFFATESTLAGGSEITIPTVVFKEEASFETLRQESYLPAQVVPLEPSRGGTLDELKWNTLYPMQNYGYPSGASGVSLGGRSIDDTQVTTLGVPLNLPQGGGADFSFFPSFLWSQALLSPTISSAGFSPQSASGNLELIPWSWSILRNERESQAPSRITASWDRDLQTLSIGTRKSDIAILAGSTFGRQTGPAGSLTYRFLRTPNLTLTANVIGADQDGENPGPTFDPTPGARKKTIRVIPSLESSLELPSGFKLKSTAFADIQKLDYADPDPTHYNTQDQSQVFGIENALSLGENRTIAFSARSVHFTSSTSGTYQEWPAYLGWTETLKLLSSTRLKLTGNAEYLSGMGFYPGARVSAEHSLSPRETFFAELQATPKLPSLQDRYYVLGTYYRGNPDLKPERVYSFSFGYEDEASRVKSRTLIRSEYRESLILFAPPANVTGSATMMNAGNAQLISLSENLKTKIIPELHLKAQALLTYSKLLDSNLPYPGLPYVSVGGSVLILPRDTVQLETQAKWMGQSTTSGGASQSGYTLFGEKASIALTADLDLGVGIDNLFDVQAEAVPGFPLPGRMVYTSIEARF